MMDTAERERRILEQLQQNLEQGGVEEIRLLKKEETGLERDILTSLHPGIGTMYNLAEGEFSFGENRFDVRFNLVPELSPEGAAPLCVLICLFNAALPAGCFAYDTEEEALIYLLRTPVAAGLSEEALLALCDRCIAVALSVLEQHAGDLIRQAWKTKHG